MITAKGAKTKGQAFLSWAAWYPTKAKVLSYRDVRQRQRPNWIDLRPYRQDQPRSHSATAFFLASIQDAAAHISPHHTHNLSFSPSSFFCDKSNVFHYDQAKPFSIWISESVIQVEKFIFWTVYIFQETPGKSVQLVLT